MTEVTDHILSEVSAEPAVADDESESSAPSSSTTLKERVIAALRTVFDPEIPVNIYDLGLIYRIEPMGGAGDVEIDMTLTAPGCPVAGEMVSMVHVAVRDVACVPNVKVNLVFDPPWDQTRMSDEAKLELGFF